MIAFKHRFHGHGSLRFVYQNGKMIRSQHLAIKYILNPRRETYRVAVVVSKKVSKSAVKRNRIRRRIYEIIQTNSSSIQKPYDTVVTVYNEEIIDMKAADLQKLVTGQLRRVGVIS